MKTAYVVSTGYTDHGEFTESTETCGVYSTIEKAQEAKAKVAESKDIYDEIYITTFTVDKSPLFK